MFEITADQRGNRLYIDLTGRIDEGEIAKAADRAVREGEKLRSGFDVVNDISGFRPPSPEAAKPIKEAQAELKELGVNRVVRVADADTSQVVVNAFERRSKAVGYSGETAETVTEAEQKLAEQNVDGYTA